MFVRFTGATLYRPTYIPLVHRPTDILKTPYVHIFVMSFRAAVAWAGQCQPQGGRGVRQLCSRGRGGGGGSLPASGREGGRAAVFPGPGAGQCQARGGKGSRAAVLSGRWRGSVRVGGGNGAGQLCSRGGGGGGLMIHTYSSTAPDPDHPAGTGLICLPGKASRQEDPGDRYPAPHTHACSSTASNQRV